MNDDTIPENMIQELMVDEDPGAHDIEWLKQALQAAVTLEFATVPAYLCGMWSVKDENDPVTKSIREVVHEEMLHMSLACNLLKAIGGQPQINTYEFVPQYPAHGLPGGVKPDLVVALSGLTDASLDVFMAIEEPEEDLSVLEIAETYPRIGVFYDAILEVFERLKPELSTEGQITGPLAKMVIENLADVRGAVEMIKHQGEGSEMSPEDTGREGLAHYYLFKEIRVRKKIVYDEERKQWVHREPLAFPDVWPMAAVPAGGYQENDVTEEVWYNLRKFDETYTLLLDQLQDAWGDGGQAAFWNSIETMFKLQDFALPLMKTPIPGEEGNYGPCFRLIT